MIEQDEVHDDEGGHEMKMIKLQHGKEEREKQNQGDQGKGISIGSIFCLHSKHHRGCE